MAMSNEEKKAARRLASRKYLLKRDYGLTVKDYEMMIEKQDHRCAICGSDHNHRTTSEYFFVDHCHDTGTIRGLLCNKCNRMIGNVFDRTDVLKKMIEYLKKSP